LTQTGETSAQRHHDPTAREAIAFFDNFQKAVANNKRDAVVSMIHFPLRVQLAS
jgi:hypothetical protein